MTEAEIKYQLFYDLEKADFLARKELWQDICEKFWLLSVSLKTNLNINKELLNVFEELPMDIAKIYSAYSLYDIENETEIGKEFHVAFSKILKIVNDFLGQIESISANFINAWNNEEALDAIQTILRCEQEILQARLVEQAKQLGIIE